MTSLNRIDTFHGVDFADIDFDAAIAAGRPQVFKAALAACPLVKAGLSGNEKAMQHLLAAASHRPILSYSAAADANGRFFYKPAMDGFNFTASYCDLDAFFEQVKRQSLLKNGEAFYVGSAELLDHFPHLLDSDGLKLPSAMCDNYMPRAGIWMGNQTVAATHFDVSNNAAACLVGRRRFTLFPVEQIENLYPGPLEPTPGGQVVSMFDPRQPDYKAFPKAEEAMRHAHVVELAPGDVLVYPAMWWHQVEALADFNVMVNYWWNPVPAFVDDPMTTLLHGMLSLRDRPMAEKRAWRALMDYYVFGEAEQPRQHLPEPCHGALANMDAQQARRLRGKLIKRLNR